MIVPPALDFNSLDITSYGEDEDIDSTMTVEDDGATLHIVGNGWKQVDFPYRVKPDTVIEFDFRGAAEGEIQGIGLDNDISLSPDFTFKFYGSEDWGILDYDDYDDTEPDWKHYVIPIGEFYTGDMNYLFFANDHDVTDPTSDSSFSNVRVYDTTIRALRQYNGEDELIIELAYSPDGTSFIDALGNSRTHAYDDRNILGVESDPLGNEQSKTYDNNFRPTSITDEEGDTTQLAWSEDGANLTQVVDAEGNPVNLDYDDSNNLTSVVDPLGAETTYTYDGSLLTSSTDDAGNTTSYNYTTEGYLESVTDADGNTTSYTYDSYGQRASMTDASGSTWLYRYDDLGRLIESENPNGVITRSEYDAAGRLVRSTRNYDPARPQNDENLYNIVSEYVYDEVGNQIEAIDTFDRSTQYVYDDANRLITTIDPAGNETTSTYNAAGQLVASTDALGHTTTYVYDELGRLVEMRDALNNATTTNYNPDGTVASTSDALGNSTTYTYDDLKRVVATTNALNGTTTTTYDEVGNVVATTDALNRTTTFAYNSLGQLESQTDPEGGITQYVYDDLGNRIETIDPRGHSTTYAYDDQGRLETVTDALNGTTTYTYDNLGNRLTVTDAENNTTSYSYDDLGRQVSVTGPLGNTTSTAYDALGRVLSRTDANGEAATYVYDTLGRLETQTDPLSGETSYTYDAVGNQLTVTDAEGHTTTMVYDELNRPLSVTDPLGNTTTTTYDAAGNVLTTTDGSGETTTFTYDDLGRQETITDPLDNTTSYAYDAAGNRLSLTDANGIVTHYEYDDVNRLTAVVENYVDGATPDHETNVRTEYGYDSNGNRLTILDGRGHTTTFSYDELNRLESEADPLGNSTSYTYDSVGRRISLTDAEGFTTNYAYDDSGRLTTIDYPDPDADVSFTYDDNGNRLSMSDGVGATTWNYDELGRITSVTDPFGDTVSYAYDSVGNRVTLTYPDGKTVSYAYDSGDRLTQVSDWDSGVTDYSYDSGNRLATVTLPNGVVTTYSYDEAGQLLELTHEADGTLLSSFTYTYDSAGNRTQVVEYYLTPGGGGGGPTVNIEVVDERGDPMADLSVYAFDEATYTGYHETTDENGEAAITLPEGEYRFRVDVDGTQLWSGEANHCTIAGCTEVLFTIPDAVRVHVQDSSGPVEGLPVYVFDETTYTGKHAATDENGEAVLRLVEGSYRFRADRGGTQFWSGESNHCDVPGCTLVDVSVTIPVTVIVTDSLDMPAEGIPVYAFSGGAYSGYHGTSDADGQVAFILPQGDYRFRADSNGTQFWSDEIDHCSVPGCLDAAVEITLPVTVTVADSDGTPLADLPVYTFDDTTYTGYHATTDANGEVSLTLPAGEYRFRADSDGTQFWSGESNHCAVPGCSAAHIIITLPVTVTVLDTDDQPAEGLPVYAFDDTTYTGYHATTDSAGQVALTLPQGDYRFRADKNGTQFWSGESNHCTLPGCTQTSVTVTIPVTVSVTDIDEQPLEGVPVYAFDESTYTGYHATTDAAGEVSLTLPLGDYRFRADSDGTQFWSGEDNHCTLPGCTAVALTIDATPPGASFFGAKRGLAMKLPVRLAQGTLVVVTVLDTDGQPAEGLPVYAFDGITYTGVHGTTDAAGRVSLDLPDGSYRFRADLNGTQFWSGETNHCTLPDCTAAGITVTIPVTITVLDTDGQPAEGLPVYAFDESAYTGYHAATDSTGQVTLTLPQGEYRFRADKNGTQFWSGESNHCTVPDCTEADITVTLPVTVTVLDTDNQPAEGLPVYAFDETTYTGYHATTDAAGQVSLTLPEGDYRFRADKNGTQFWSGESNHCTLPGCTEAGISVTIPITVTVQSQTGDPYPDLPVYAFSAGSYTGFHGTTDANGQVILTLPQGDYRFRADFDGVHFWSGESDHCSIPGCLEATVALPGGGGTEPQNVTIDYTYDPLYRLTAADYDSGEYFHYTYDEVGNRLTQETLADTNTYTYDNANRLTGVDSVSYTWSANGNLLSDGESTYTYNHANRLTGFAQGEDSYTYAYNGLGDRLTQTVDGDATIYTLDLVAGLTQVLEDGTNAYLYGLYRVGEKQTAGWAYHLPDALGSVRQLTDANASVTLERSYEPFGGMMTGNGLGETKYSFTGEWADGTGLVYLRARYYVPWQGRFLSIDDWNGNDTMPISLNGWVYVNENPINFSDPSGHWPSPPMPWHPPIAACIHCYSVSGSVARKYCFEECLCGIMNKEDDGFPTTCPGRNCVSKGMFNLSSYYITHETQYYHGEGAEDVVIPGGDFGSTKANEYFLFSKGGVCTQGTGRLKDGRLIGCVSSQKFTKYEPINNKYGFWEYYMIPKDDRDKVPFFRRYESDPILQGLEPFRTVAVCANGPISHNENVRIYAPGLRNFLHAWDPQNIEGVLTVTDSGEGLCPRGIDIYVGEETPFGSGQNIAHSAYIAVMSLPAVHVYVEIK